MLLTASVCTPWHTEQDGNCGGPSLPLLCTFPLSPLLTPQRSMSQQFLSPIPLLFTCLSSPLSFSLPHHHHKTRKCLSNNCHCQVTRNFSLCLYDGLSCPGLTILRPALIMLASPGISSTVYTKSNLSCHVICSDSVMQSYHLLLRPSVVMWTWGGLT